MSKVIKEGETIGPVKAATRKLFFRFYDQIEKLKDDIEEIENNLNDLRRLLDV